MFEVVVLRDASEIGDQVEGVLTNWVGASLIRSIVVVALSESEPWVVHRLGPDGATEVDLYEDLGRQRLDHLVVVAAQLVEPGAESRVALAAGAREAGSTLRRAVSESTNVILVNLLVPASGTSDISPAALLPDWTVNVVASTEDRKSGMHADQSAARDFSYAGHAALAVASVGSCLPGMSEPLFGDGVPRRMGLAPIKVARTFGRFLDGGYLVDHIADGVLRLRDSWPIPSTVPTSEPLDFSDALRRKVAGAIADADHRALRFNPAERVVFPPARPCGILAAFAMMFQFIWAAIRRLPYNVVTGVTREVKRRAEAWTQKVTFGEDSEFYVSFGGRARADAATSGPPTIDDVERVVRMVEELLERPTRPPAQPELWRAMRGVMIGLLDGAPVPAIVDPALVHNGVHRLVVSDPATIVPHPDGLPLLLPQELYAPGQPLERWQGADIGQCDVLTMAAIRAALADAVLASTAGESAATEDTAPDDSAADVDGRDTSEDEDAAGDREDPGRLPHALAAVEEWASLRVSSLAGRVGEIAAREIDRATKVFEAAWDSLRTSRAEEALAEEAAEAPKLRKKLFRRWFVIAVVIAVLCAVSIVLLPLAVIALPVLVVLGVLGWGWAFLRYQRAFFQLQHRRMVAETELEQAERDVVNALEELRRLCDRYREFLDWSEIVGWLLHRPWGFHQADVKVPEPLAAPSLPKALVTGYGLADRARVRRLRAQATRRIIVPGWIERIYEDALHDAMVDFQIDRGIDEDEASLPDPDVDNRADDDSPRRALLRTIRDGQYANESRADAGREIAKLTEQLSPDEVYNQVALGIRSDAGAVIAAESASGALDLVGLGFGGSEIDARRVARVVVPAVVHLAVVNSKGEAGTGSGVVVADGGIVVTNAHVVMDASSVHVQLSDGRSCDGEVLGRRPQHDIAVVRLRGLSAPPIAVAGDGSESLEVGQPVLAVGNPLGLAGGPSVSRGIVSAIGRTASFEDGTSLANLIQTDAATSPGSSGGALVDARGRLIGITAAGMPRGENIGFAIAVADAMRIASELTELAEPEVARTPLDDGDEAAIAIDEQSVGNAETYPPSEFMIELWPADSEHLTRAMWLDESLAGEATRFDRVKESVLWMSANFVDDTRSQLGHLSVRPLARAAVLGSPVLDIALRVDFSEPCQSEDLAVFARSHEELRSRPRPIDAASQPPSEIG